MTQSKRNRKKQELATITSGNLALLMHSPFDSTFEKPFSRELFLMCSMVIGTNYVRYFRKYLKEVHEGDRVVLVREPKNEADKYAILVKNQKGHKLGYIPRRHNKVIARLMDAGKCIYGIATDITIPQRRDEMYWYMKVRIFMED